MTPSSEHVWLAAQRLCLRLAPRSFRERFGAELLACSAEALRDARAAGGPRAQLLRGAHQLLDLGCTVFLLRLSHTPMRTLLCLPLALLASVGIAWIDTHQSEVQPAVLLLLVAGALLAFLDSARAWLWWILLGLSIPGAALWMRLVQGTTSYQGPFYGTFIAFVPAGLGALAGYATRRLLSLLFGSGPTKPAGQGPGQRAE